MIRYGLRNNETGKLIALDQASGGYPYDVADEFNAQWWGDINDAHRYNAVSSWKDYDHPVYTVVSCEMDIRYVETATGEALRNYRDRK